MNILLSFIKKVKMSDSEEVTKSVLKRRACCERWKIRNREKYLNQKRILGSRDSYKLHRKVMYRERVDELKVLGILPRKRGRHQLYTGSEALEVKRHRAREATTRYRARQISHLKEKYESESSTTAS